MRIYLKSFLGRGVKLRWYMGLCSIIWCAPFSRRLVMSYSAESWEVAKFQAGWFPGVFLPGSCLVHLLGAGFVQLHHGFGQFLEADLGLTRRWRFAAGCRIWNFWTGRDLRLRFSLELRLELNQCISITYRKSNSCIRNWDSNNGFWF